MDYKLKYWLTSVGFGIVYFLCFLIISLLKDKSSIDILEFVKLFGIVLFYVTIMSFILIIPFCKPYEFIIKYKSQDQKQNILDKLNNFTIYNKKEFGQFKREIKEVNGNVINYITKNKYANMYIPKVQIAIMDEKIIVSGPAYYITMIKQL